jgi:uncharacterized coiled-coil protein SlyX
MEKLKAEQLSALKLKDAKTHIEELYAYLDSVTMPTDERVAKLETELAEKDSTIAAKDEAISEMETAIVELNKSLSDSEKSASKADNVISIGGKNYRMTAAKAKLGDITVTLDLLKRDEELANECVEMGVGYLVLIESKEKEA